MCQSTGFIDIRKTSVCHLRKWWTQIWKKEKENKTSRRFDTNLSRVAIDSSFSTRKSFDVSVILLRSLRFFFPNFYQFFTNRFIRLCSLLWRFVCRFFNQNDSASSHTNFSETFNLLLPTEHWKSCFIHATRLAFLTL